MHAKSTRGKEQIIGNREKSTATEKASSPKSAIYTPSQESAFSPTQMEPGGSSTTPSHEAASAAHVGESQAIADSHGRHTPDGNKDGLKPLPLSPTQSQKGKERLTQLNVQQQQSVFAEGDGKEQVATSQLQVQSPNQLQMQMSPASSSADPVSPGRRDKRHPGTVHGPAKVLPGGMKAGTDGSGKLRSGPTSPRSTVSSLALSPRMRTYADVVAPTSGNLGILARTTTSSSAFSTSASGVDDVGVGTAGVDGEADTEALTFFSGNPHVEIVTGVMHLYRANNTSASAISDTLCVLSVPAWMSPADFCSYISPYQPLIQHIRILRDSSPNKYMALLRFNDHTSAAKFYREHNGTPFTSMAAEACHIVYVADVQYESDASADVVTPPVGGTELPTCPVCLERLDTSISGVLTILCNHSFHSACLSKWGDSTCPVCRYCQEQSPESQCDICASTQDLWICLICAFIGCGRYSGSHAYEHFKSSMHTYSMELHTQRVWDYAGDGYVHRLIQNRADGKLVELPAPAVVPAGSPEPSHGDDPNSYQPKTQLDFNSKMDSLALEYNYLLTSQLDQQRQYFEDKHAQDVAHLTQLHADLAHDLQLEQEEKAKAIARAVAAEQDKRGAHKHITELNKRIKALESELDFTKRVNESLIENQEKLKEQLAAASNSAADAAKDTLIAELQEQVRDLMFFLGAQRTISESADKDDIQNGHVVVPPTESPSSSLRSKLRNKKR